MLRCCLVAPLLLGACSDPSSGSGGDAGSATGDTHSVTPAEPFQLRDEARQRGFERVNRCGPVTAKRYLLEEIGNGCALLDYDLDGDLDVYLVESGSLAEPSIHGEQVHPAGDGLCRLYANDGRGYFEDVTEASGAGLTDFAVGATVADYDNDGDPDLYVTCWGKNRLLRNDGGRFTDVTDEAGVGDARWSVGATWLDADRDGDLDLYVSNYFSMDLERDPDCWRKINCPYHDLVAACGPKGMVAEPDSFYLNQGQGRFEEASAEWGTSDVEERYGLGVVSFDHDQDGDIDIYVANDSRGNFLFDNEDGRTFFEMSDLSGASLSRNGAAQAGMGIACGDLDGDLDLDLFLTNFAHDLNTLYRNEGGGEFLDVTERMGFRQDVYFSLGWGTEFVDFDNDGSLELFVANGHIYPEADQRAPELTYRQLNRIYRLVDDKMQDVTAASGPGMARLASSRGAAFGDLDNDGDIDVLVVEMNERPSLLINDLDPKEHRSVLISLEGRSDNRDGIGARVIADLGSRQILRVVRSGHSFASCNDPRLHFGLGASEILVRLTITWPNGDEQVVQKPAAGRWLHVVQGQDEAEVRLP